MNKLSIFNLISAIILILNLFIFSSPVLGVIFGLSFILISSYLLNKNLLIGFLLFLCLVIIPLTLIYYVWEFNSLVVGGWMILFSMFLLWRNKKYMMCMTQLSSGNFPELSCVSATHAFIVFYFLFLFIAYLFLKQGVTVEAIRTPWAVISKWFFIFYFLSTASLIYLLTKKISGLLKIILSAIHLFFSFSIANVIYKLGFGFDPYIHQATEKYILENGFILPKKLYYIGQYVVVGFFSKLFQVSHVGVDKNLVPVLASILIPSVFYKNWKLETCLPARQVGNWKFLYLFLFLIIPFSFLTFTTPQNLGYLLVLVMIFLWAQVKDQRPTNMLILFFLMPLMIFMIHPIAGVSAFIFLAIMLIEKYVLKYVLKYLLYLILCFAFPVVFGIFSMLSGFPVKLINNFDLASVWQNLFRWSPDLFWFPSITHILKSVAYFVWQPAVVFFVILIFAVLGIIKFKKSLNNSITPNLITFIILFINSLLLYSFVDFPFLIDYERGDFAFRIFTLGVFFLIPLALMGILRLWQVIKPGLKAFKPGLITVFLVLLLAGGITTSLYFSYPRQDVYYYERGFNTSQADFDVIKYLENNTNQDYVVLANQQVGAGALATYGFRYFKDQYFFYSIPTGGPLYQIYWNVVYSDAGRDEIKKASDLTGAKIVYVYFPKYWFNLGKMKNNLISQADDEFEIDGGVVFEFRY